MPVKKINTSTVYVQGPAGMRVVEDVVEYKLLDFKASTYHMFLFSDGVVEYLNDFGIKSVKVVPPGVRFVPTF